MQPQLPEATPQTRDVAVDHQTQVTSYATAAAIVAGQMWSDVDPDHIAASWTQQVPELTKAVSGAQLGAARLADGYTDEALRVQSLDDEAEQTVNPEGFAGTASDGRGLASLLMNPVVITLLTIADIHDVSRALSRGRANLDTIVRTQVMDAGRLADQSSLVAHRAATGYVRVTDGKPCARCLLLAGRVYEWNAGFKRHERCGCTHIPTLLANPRWQRIDPREIYDSMTPRERLRAGFTLSDQQALAEGADLGQIINARHRPQALFTAGGRKLTREGTTRRGLFGGFQSTPDGLRRRPPGIRRAERLTPDEIFKQAGGNRDEAIRLLVENRYLIQDVPRALTARASIAVSDRVVVRAELVAAKTVDEVGEVLAREYARLTGRTVDVQFSGSVATARDHAEGLLRAAERFPAGSMTSVRVGPTQGFYALTDRSSIIFSDDWAGVAARKDYLAAVQADMRSAWHPPRTSSPSSVAMHEYAHSIPFDREAMGRLVGDRAKQISGYAARDLDEAVAEAVVDVLVNGERAGVLSRQVVDLLDRGPLPMSARRLQLDETFTARRAGIERDFAARRAELQARSAARAELRELRAAERMAMREARAAEAAARRGLRQQEFTARRELVASRRLLPSGPDPSRMSVAALKTRAVQLRVTPPSGIRKPALVRLVDDLESGVDPAVARARAVEGLAPARAAKAVPATGPRAPLTPAEFDRALSAATSGDDALRVAGVELRTAAERTAYADYVSQYRFVNGTLRENAGQIPAGRAFAADRRLAAGLDSAMARSQLAEDLQLYRISGTVEFPGGIPRVGAEWTDHGYVSTSVRPKLDARRGDVEMRILAPAGTRAVATAELDVGEVLLGRGQSYRVVRVAEPDARGVWRVDVEVVPAAPAKAAAKKAVPTKATPAKVTPATQRSFDRRAADAVTGDDVASQVPVNRNSPTLTQVEREALDSVLSTDFEDVGAVLRGRKSPFGTSQRALDRKIGAIDDVMRRSPLQSDVELWRGTQSGRSVFGERLAGDLTGFEWTEASFVSTSYRRSAAEIFATHGAGTGSPGVLLRMVTPRGVQAVQLFGGEAEIFLQRGLRMRVIRDHGISDVPVRDAFGQIIAAPHPVRILDVEVISARAPVRAAVKKAAPLPAKPLTVAQREQVAMDSAREMAEQAAEVEQAVANQASARAVVSITRSRMRRLKIEPVDASGATLSGTNGTAARYVWRRPGGDVDLSRPRPRDVTAEEFAAAKKLADTALEVERLSADGVTDALTVAVRKRVARQKLTPTAKAGEVVPYDPATMDVIGPPPPKGTFVLVRKPGYTWKRPDGKVLTVDRVQVQDAATPEQIAAARAAAAKGAGKGRASRPAYLDTENSLLLQEYAESIGLDLRRFVDPTRNPMVAFGEPLERQYPFSFVFAEIVDGLRSGKVNQAAAIVELRAWAPRFRRQATDARRQVERLRGIDAKPVNRDLAVVRDGDDAADLAERLADALEGLKLPRRKRLPTLSGVTAGDISELGTIDEALFEMPGAAGGAFRRTASPKGGLVLHRGEVVPESFEHPRSGMGLFNSETRAVRPGLTQAENDALDQYVLAAIADPLNGALRAGRIADLGTADLARVGLGVVDLDDVMANLDSAIANSVISRNATLWRGALLRPVDLRKLQPGAIITELGFMSTAADSQLAREIIKWRRQNAPGHRQPVVYKILADEGTHAAVGHEAAGEVLLGRGTRLQVVRVGEPDFEGVREILVRLLPD